MRKKISFFCLICLICLIEILFCYSSCFSEEETFTITTYYPSPYGSYNELTTYSNTNLAIAGGSVGIGTTAPYGRLHVTNIGWGDQTPSADSASFPVSGSGGLVLDGGYTNGQYRTRFVKIDRGWNLPLYIQQSTSTANSFSNIARFGTHQYSQSAVFEVFGNTALDGDVGIGTTSPGRRTDIQGSAINGAYTPLLRVATNDIAYGGSGGGIELAAYNNNGTIMPVAALAPYLTDGGAGVQTGDLIFQTASGGTLGERVRVTSAGNVGIGTADPVGPLQVGISPSPGLLVTSTGNVGIGTASPQAKLNVQDGNIAVTNGSVTAGASGFGFSQYGSLNPSSGQGGVFGQISGPMVASAEGWLGYRGSFGSAGVYGRDNVNSYAGYFEGPAGAVGITDGSEIVMTRAARNYIDATDPSGSLSFGTGGVANRMVIDAAGNVIVKGTIIATGVGVKLFEIDHPTKPNLKLVHACIEGPEVAVFYRGEGQLKNGKAEVSLPDYFEALTRKESRTVLITPQFKTDDEPISMLSASVVKDGKFKVRAIDKNNPAQEFYWEVKGVRSDVGILQVEKPKQGERQ